MIPAARRMLPAAAPVAVLAAVLTAVLAAVLTAVSPPAGAARVAASAPPDTTPPGPPGSPVDVPLRIESQVRDVPTEDFRAFVVATLDDPRSWGTAGFRFRADDTATYRVVLAEPAEVDRLCLPLRTNSAVSCQNGPVVALNAERWRRGPGEWDRSLAEYRQYMVNHEVGHLVGQRHPTPRCPAAGTPAAVMEQQTKGLAGCTGNAWPLWWELDRAAARPAVLAPPPEWGPDPVPANLGGAVAAPTTSTTATTATTAVPPSTAPVPSTVRASTTAPASGSGPSQRPGRASAAVARRAGAATPTDAGDGSGGPVLAWLVVAGGLVLGGVGATVVVRRRRGSAPVPPVAGAAPDRPAWSVTVRRGGAPLGRHGDVLWVVPPRWEPATAADLVARVADDLARQEPGRTVRSLLATDPPGGLAPDEGLAVVVEGSGRARVLVLGTAEAVLEEGGRRSRRRRAVVDVDPAAGVSRFGVVVPAPAGSSGGPSSLLLDRGHDGRAGEPAATGAAREG